MKNWIAAGILLFGAVFFYQYLQNNHQNWVNQQNVLQQQQAQQDLNQRFTDCMKKAEGDYVAREIESCINRGMPQDQCTNNPPAILAGPIYDNYQQDKNNCSTQNPGAGLISQ